MRGVWSPGGPPCLVPYAHLAVLLAFALSAVVIQWERCYRVSQGAIRSSGDRAHSSVVPGDSAAITCRSEVETISRQRSGARGRGRMWSDVAARWRWAGATIASYQHDERCADWHRHDGSACHAATCAPGHTAAGTTGAATGSATGSAQDDGNHQEADDALDAARCPSGRILFTGRSFRAYQRRDLDAVQTICDRYSQQVARCLDRWCRSYGGRCPPSSQRASCLRASSAVSSGTSRLSIPPTGPGPEVLAVGDGFWV
jgi:hypothetical protein